MEYPKVQNKPKPISKIPSKCKTKTNEENAKVHLCPSKQGIAGHDGDADAEAS